MKKFKERKLKESGHKKSKMTLRLSIALMSLLLAIAVMGASAVTNYLELKVNLNDVFNDYLLDEVISAGDICNLLYADGNAEIPQLRYKQYIGNLKIEQLPSSYTYVVDATNNLMVYHPTEGKIGEPVSNEVILQLCKDIQAGKTNFKARDCVTYVFKGVEKKAAYTVVANNSLIVVTTADSSDILAVIKNIVTKDLMFGSITTLFCLLGIFVLLHFLLKPLSGISKVVEQIGQLDLCIDEAELERLQASPSEVSRIATALKNLKEELEKVIIAISDKSNDLISVSSNLKDMTLKTVERIDSISSACNDIANGATSQAQETEDAANQVTNIGDLIATNIKVVEELKQSSDDVRVYINEAHRQMILVQDSNNNVIDITSKIKDAIKETGDSAKDIKVAAGLITEIAEQTNLLSLNASIEAARAGESGRGFAVVAQEIQKLAEQSNDAASKIEEVIEELIKNSQESEEAINIASTTVEDQTEKLQHAITSFSKSIDSLDKSLEFISTVDESTASLDNAKQEVMGSVESLTAIAEENAASTEETFASISEAQETVQSIDDESNNISTDAEQLNELINKWRV